jgi:hypothetical protein
MMRLLALLLIMFLVTPLLAEDELPQDPSDPMDIEPPLLIQEIPGKGPVAADPGVVPELDPDRIQAALEKAKKSAAAGERLYRSGVIAKVEAENRVLKIVRLEADLANARWEIAKHNVEEQQTRFDAGEIAQAELETAKSALASAATEAEAVTARRQQAELEAALLNLRRQKKLLAVGSGRKAEVSRAEEKVTALQQPQN